MSFDTNKVQLYLAKDWDEYERALKIAQEDDRVIDIKEVGEMETTDWNGERMFAYIFALTAPSSYMSELTKLMNVPMRYI